MKAMAPSSGQSNMMLSDVICCNIINVSVDNIASIIRVDCYDVTQCNLEYSYHLSHECYASSFRLIYQK
jgi:hypothetical protein